MPLSCAHCGRLPVLLLLLVSLAPTASVHFRRLLSKTFVDLHRSFQVEYVDGSILQGFVGQDVIQLGRHYTTTDFGCIVRDQGHWLYEGILGVGMPEVHSDTTPYLFALSEKDAPRWKVPSNDPDEEGSDWQLRQSGRILDGSPKPTVSSDSTEAPMPEMMPMHWTKAPHFPITGRIFSIAMTQDGGELQLGGYVAASVLHPPLYVSVLPTYCSAERGCLFKHYAVRVDAMYWGDTKLLNDHKGVLDSGTSCMVLPKEAYAEYLKQMLTRPIEHSSPIVYITISGRVFKILIAEQSCVKTLPKYPHKLILGDVFFRRHVVIHDLRNMNSPRIGIAQRHPSYQVVSTATPRSERTWVMGNASAQARLEIDRVPFVSSEGGMQYAVELQVGSPRQRAILVSLDTGSSLLAISTVSHENRLHTIIHMGIIVGGALLGCLFIFIRKSGVTETKEPPTLAATAGGYSYSSLPQSAQADGGGGAHDSLL